MSAITKVRAIACVMLVVGALAIMGGINLELMSHLPDGRSHIVVLQALSCFATGLVCCIVAIGWMVIEEDLP